MNDSVNSLGNDTKPHASCASADWTVLTLIYKNNMKKIILSLSVLGCFSAFADSNSGWLASNTGYQKSSFIDKKNLKKRRFILDESHLKNRLNRTTNSFSTYSNLRFAARSVVSNEISLPLPDGEFILVTATPTQIISDEMAEAHPNIKTWKVKSVDNPEITGVIDFTSNGFHGMLMMPDGDVVFINPDKEQEGDIYDSISKNQNKSAFNTHLNCDLHDGHTAIDHMIKPQFAVKPAARNLEQLALQTADKAIDDTIFPNVSITDLKTYRLALSATAEYTANRGGTAAARASMVTSINRINPIFERDLGVSLELIDAPELIFTDASTDPFPSPNDPAKLMIDNGEYLAAQNRLDDFDLGHVLSHRTDTNGGSGVAFLKVACLDEANDSDGNVIRGLKGAGATTSGNPYGETFDLVLLAHELGHQLGASHSFNSAKTRGCSGGRSPVTAVEPGSGSTIMSYNGVCGTDDLPENPRDDYFHFASISQITQYTREDHGSTCGSLSSNTSKPSANAGVDVNIPANTPFLLDGTASSGTASWDQIDAGDASEVDIDNGGNAIIRHIIPTQEQDRYIPSLANLFAGTTAKGEIMPTTTRELNFAYVVRDNGVSSDKKLINVTDTGSTFAVTSQTENETFIQDKAVDIRWNTANTEQAPINCSHVDIQLLRENGVKNMLLASTPNDGAQSLTVPTETPVLTDARVIVGCSDNSFFNISSGAISVQGDEPEIADTTKPVITMLGANPVNVMQGDEFTDEGATATDNIDGAVTVTRSSNVNTSVAGNYTVTYSATDSAGNTTSVMRDVVVTSAPEPEPAADTKAPVIRIVGDINITQVEGSSYVDQGATVTDNVDTNLTVTTSSNVDTSKVGTYIVRYSAVDAAGNQASAIRTVVITADESVLGNNLGGSDNSTNENESDNNSTNDGATKSGGGGGGSMNYWFLSLLSLLGFRKLRPVSVTVKNSPQNNSPRNK